MEDRTAYISEVEKIMSKVKNIQDYLDLHIDGYRELDITETIEANKAAQAIVPTSKDERYSRLILMEKKGALVYAPQGICERDLKEGGIYLYDGKGNTFFPFILETEPWLDRDDFEMPSDFELGSIDLSEVM